MLGFELSNNDVKAILTNMFVGGTDTTATTLEWAVSELVKHPTIMKKTQEELTETNSGKHDIDMSEIFGLGLTKKEPLLLKPITFSF
ncbi:hypothetical protein P8452_70803 [Trifolium repens]|nr:hypothetical protein P8452_70803 [Trifolium repens]